uniref:hypothetical protein n=1 Tax=Burkholderia cepacia TaxID=292 RepID=UPI0038573229
MFVGDRFDVVGRGFEQVEGRQFDVERRGRVEFERVRTRRAGGGVGGGAAGSVVAVAAVASAGGAAGIAGTGVTAAGADRLAPGNVVAGCRAGAAGVAATFDTCQLAGDEAGAEAGGAANVVASIAAGAEAIDGACVGAVAPKDGSEPVGATGEPEIGCAGVAAADVIGATAPGDGAVVSETAGGTGRLAAGCGATGPEVPNPEVTNVPKVVPVDELAGLACAGACETDAVFTGIAVASVGAGAVEPDVEADVPAVDGVTTGDVGVDARGNES